MTYAEKLKDPRWMEFRQGYLSRMRGRHPEREDDLCESCGVVVKWFELHHRRYREGAEPWEYEDEELLLCCEECHDRIHRVERMARAWILWVPPHLLYEFEDFFREVESSHAPKAALACAKNAVREANLRFPTR